MKIVKNVQVHHLRQIPYTKGSRAYVTYVWGLASQAEPCWLMADVDSIHVEHNPENSLGPGVWAARLN